MTYPMVGGGSAGGAVASDLIYWPTVDQQIFGWTAPPIWPKINAELDSPFGELPVGGSFCPIPGTQLSIWLHGGTSADFSTPDNPESLGYTGVLEIRCRYRVISGSITPLPLFDFGLLRGAGIWDESPSNLAVPLNTFATFTHILGTGLGGTSWAGDIIQTRWQTKGCSDGGTGNIIMDIAWMRITLTPP